MKVISSKSEVGDFDEGGYSILVVDDDPNIRHYVRVVLTDSGYQVDCAVNGFQAMTMLANNAPDLICLDLYLPDISGVDLLRQIRVDPTYKDIPVVIITVSNERDVKLECLKQGANEFLRKPLDYAELSTRVANLLRVKRYGDLLKQYNVTLEEQVKSKTVQIRRHCVDTVMTLTRAAEFRDEDTGCHVARISHYSKELAQALGMDDDFAEKIFYASPMHDIGKLAIPDHILLKRGALSKDEWDVMKTHASVGKGILHGHGSPYLEMGADIAESHHEYWDGSGYPNGLKGEAIPLPARIVALCDVYDALRSKRPYKSFHNHDEAMNMIRLGDTRTRPGHFDPEVFSTFLGISDRFAEIYDESLREADFELGYSKLH